MLISEIPDNYAWCPGRGLVRRRLQIRAGRSFTEPPSAAIPAPRIYINPVVVWSGQCRPECRGQRVPRPGERIVARSVAADDAGFGQRRQVPE